MEEGGDRIFSKKALPEIESPGRADSYMVLWKHYIIRRYRSPVGGDFQSVPVVTIPYVFQ
jgi:hypothetical protein